MVCALHMALQQQAIWALDRPLMHCLYCLCCLTSSLLASSPPWQVAAQALGIPLSAVFIAETSTDKVPNPSPTAASASSDMYGAATLDACDQINARLAPFRERLPGEWPLKSRVCGACQWLPSWVPCSMSLHTHQAADAPPPAKSICDFARAWHPLAPWCGCWL